MRLVICSHWVKVPLVILHILTRNLSHLHHNWLVLQLLWGRCMCELLLLVECLGLLLREWLLNVLGVLDLLGLWLLVWLDKNYLRCSISDINICVLILVCLLLLILILDLALCLLLMLYLCLWLTLSISTASSVDTKDNTWPENNIDYDCDNSTNTVITGKLTNFSLIRRFKINIHLKFIY